MSRSSTTTTNRVLKKARASGAPTSIASRLGGGAPRKSRFSWGGGLEQTLEETSAGSKNSPPRVFQQPANREQLPNPHPGEILLKEFLEPLGLSQNALARAVRVPPRRINELVLGKRAVSADTDLRLARYFGVSEGFFLGLQADFDLMERRRQIGAELAAIAPRAA